MMKLMISFLSIFLFHASLINGLSTGICVVGGGGVWQPLNGIWQPDGELYGAIKYKQIQCARGISDCGIARTLAIERVNGHYIFSDANGRTGTKCQDGQFHTSPDLCTDWWGTSAVNYVSKCDYTTPPTRAPSSVTQSPTTAAPTPVPTYNLINPYPECYYSTDVSQRYCAEMYGNPPNWQQITHPNYAERAHSILMNMARLFPTTYAASKYGWGSGAAYYPDEVAKDNYCGIKNPIPHYYSLKMNQMGRFWMWDASSCPSGSHGHTTCPERCHLFETFKSSTQVACSMAARSRAFAALPPHNYEFIRSEGGCHENYCYIDGHCSAAFDPTLCDNVNTDHCAPSFGIGVWWDNYNGGGGSMGIDYGHNGDNDRHNYPLVWGAHLDDSYIWNNDPQFNAETTSKKIRFILQYYGNQNANNVYLLYKNNKNKMNLMPGFGNTLSGFYEVSFTILPTDNCEPYAFLAETKEGPIYRLPENKRYYFGTSFFKFGNTEPTYECSENHYFKNDEAIWIQNNGERDLIPNDNGCVGCAKIASLEQLQLE